MERERQLLLPPPAQPLLLPPPRPASASLPPLPPRPSATLGSALRSLRPPPVSSIPRPLVNVFMNIFTDLHLLRSGLKGLKRLLEKQKEKAPTNPRADFLLRHVPVAMEWNPLSLLQKFLEESDAGEVLKAAVTIGGAAVLLYVISMSLGLQEEAGADRDEDEEALVAGKLPEAARRQLLLLALPLVPVSFPPRPLPPWPRQDQTGTSNVAKAPATSSSDSKEIQDNPYKDGFNQTEQVIISSDYFKDMDDHKDGFNQTEQVISSVPAADVQSIVQDTKTKFDMEWVATETESLVQDTKGMFDKESVPAAADIQSMIQDTKTKFEKERQNSVKALTKTSKEYEGSLNTEYTKFEVTPHKFCKDKAAHVQNFKDLFSKSKVEKDILIVQYELQRKKEKATLSELEKTVSEKITDAGVSLKKMKQKAVDLSEDVERKLQTCLVPLASREKDTLPEKTVSHKIADAEASLKKMKQGDKSISTDEFGRD